MELLDEIDANNRLTGKVLDKEEFHKKGLWHREVTVIIVNSEKQLLLQKRAACKKQCPNMWAETAGHIDSKEDERAAALRETWEELGIPDLKLEDFEFLDIRKFSGKGDGFINNIFDYVYLLKTNLKLEEFVLQKAEVSEVKYFTIDELKNIYANKEKYEKDFTNIFFEEFFLHILNKLES